VSYEPLQGGRAVSSWLPLQPGQWACAVLTRNASVGLHVEKGPQASAERGRPINFTRLDLAASGVEREDPSVAVRSVLC
jgi:hypothetical protein